MNRRDAIGALACGMWGTLAQAQQPAPIQPWRIGFLTMHDPAKGQVIVDMFVAEMRARGWEPGREFVLEVRHGERNLDLIEARAKELVQLQPQLLIGGASPTTAALARATRTRPIIGQGMTLPVEAGLVQSLARPGGNVTGSTFNPIGIGGKVMETLLIAAPRVSRLVVVSNPGYPGFSPYGPHLRQAAEQLKLTLLQVDVPARESFRLQDVERARPDALWVVDDFVVDNAMQRELASFAVARRLPSIGTNRTFVEAGGLLSVSVDPHENVVVSADYAIRILVQRADPATLPVQEPSRFQVVLNRRTADAMGFTPPRELMLRVSEVIA